MTMSQGVVGSAKSPETIPNGPGGAAILAAGIGTAAIGVLAFASELLSWLPPLLNFYNPVGPLSGKTTVTIIVWLVAWFILSRLWATKTVNMRAINVVALVLLGLGFVLTFPPVWYLFD